jgi:endonuclease/exonuclease/phosphatase family metal-dependent hydrolase
VLRFVTFNIRNAEADDGPDAWHLRKPLVVRLIKAMKPDVLGLQEAMHEQLHELAAALPMFSWVGVGREDGAADGEYAPIFYRRDRIGLISSDVFWLSDTPDVPGSKSWGSSCTRTCSQATLSTGGREFSVFNCHLDHISGTARAGGMATIAQRIKAPAVLMGDFNASEAETESYRLTRNGLYDTFRVAHPHDTEVNTYTAFDLSRIDGDKIDYIFATSDFRTLDSSIVRTGYGGRAPSDHFPVVADLEFEIPEPS